MEQLNSNVLRGYFDEVLNQKHLDLFSKYISKNVTSHGSPYVGMGLMYDVSSGDKFIVQSIHPGSPADGKLMVGDEIVRAKDGERTWNTYDQLRMGGLWGQGALGTPVTVWVRRDGTETEVTLTRGMVKGFQYNYQDMEKGTREMFAEWRDLKAQPVHIIEAGDMVAYHIEAQGENVRYGRSASWSEFGFVRVQDGKIVEWWMSEEGMSELKQLGFAILAPEMVKA